MLVERFQPSCCACRLANQSSRRRLRSAKTSADAERRRRLAPAIDARRRSGASPASAPRPMASGIAAGRAKPGGEPGQERERRMPRARGGEGPDGGQQEEPLGVVRAEHVREREERQRDAGQTGHRAPAHVAAEAVQQDESAEARERGERRPTPGVRQTQRPAGACGERLQREKRGQEVRDRRAAGRVVAAAGDLEVEPRIPRREVRVDARRRHEQHREHEQARSREDGQRVGCGLAPAPHRPESTPAVGAHRRSIPACARRWRRPRGDCDRASASASSPATC